jgi:hypothetical protein
MPRLAPVTSTRSPVKSKLILDMAGAFGFPKARLPSGEFIDKYDCVKEYLDKNHRIPADWPFGKCPNANEFDVMALP